MALCDVCGREPLKGHWRSYSNIKTIRRQKLNLQAKTINGVRKRVCTSCMRTMLKTPRQRTKAKVAAAA